MKILIVSHYYPPNGGSSANQFHDLAQYLHARGHSVTVLTTMPHYPQGQIQAEFRGQFARTSDENGVRVVRVWLWATPNKRISRKLISQGSFMVTSVLRGLFLARPEMVFIESQPIFTSIAARILSFFKRTPYSQNVSDLWPDHLLSVGALTESSPVYKIARWVMDSGFRGAKRLSSMSPAWTRKLGVYTRGQHAKITTILRGTDLERFRPDLDTHAFREAHGLGKRLIVSFIGTFATQYDFDLQLNIAERLQHRPDVIFVYIGTGSQRQQVVDRAQHLPNVKLIDWVAYADMPLAWNSSTLNYWALRPEPLYEGTIPAKLYEAFACGVPVVAAQKGEAATLIQDAQAGIVVDTDDEDGLLHAIEQLLDDEPRRHTLAQHARQYALQHFDYHRALALYETLITAQETV